jgi:hypothetical protein
MPDYYTLMHYPFLEMGGMSINAEREYMVNNYGFSGVIPRSRRFFLPKACFYTGNVSSQKMYVGLAPKNKFTKNAYHELELWMWLRRKENGVNLLYRPKYFDTEEQMMEYVNHPDYMTTKDRKGLCFGITHSFE